MDSLLGLSNLVITSRQSINLQTSNYVCLHFSSSFDLLSFTLARVTPSLHFVSNDGDMWVHDAFKLYVGSPNGVEPLGFPNGVDPCVAPCLVLFESFYIPSIVFGVEDFNVLVILTLFFQNLKKFLFCHILNLFLLCHILNLSLFCCIFYLLLLAAMLLIMMMLYLLILLVMFHLNLNLRISLKKSFKMLTRAVNGQEVHLMSGTSFGV